VLSEETVVAFCLLSIFAAVGKYGGPMYKEWAEGQVQKQKDILNAARVDHTNAVQQRIEDVKQLSGVVEITQQLFEVSKVGMVKEDTILDGTSALTTTIFRKLPSSRLKPTSSNSEQL
jgi:hypothetical protein